jgi:hypothetical protein
LNSEFKNRARIFNLLSQKIIIETTSIIVPVQQTSTSSPDFESSHSNHPSSFSAYLEPLKDIQNIPSTSNDHH